MKQENHGDTAWKLNPQKAITNKELCQDSDTMMHSPVSDNKAMSLAKDSQEAHRATAGKCPTTIDIEGRKATQSTSENSRNQWAAWEDMRLIIAARKFGMDQWENIADYVGSSRNSTQCLQRWNIILEPAFSDYRNYTDFENDTILLHVHKVLDSKEAMKDSDWRDIAALLPFRSGPEVEAHWSQNVAAGQE